ncbi:helix-turn-helix domain-containing protein [Rhizobium sp. P32RR-XVIII]|uniref:helix-turn-helix domain-containing protein n=1 Tax=Rhizobium sp. P32RR-XVIII TaxID=2726738 RepID=UPI001456C07C|nr:helix-turn-helix domain-containing protein [Rhizobium sp. P32RR-XVIII]NLS02307.1 helix-turn-helix domain-containing protein [Rhizobium sp. P32RR-XVIII]
MEPDHGAISRAWSWRHAIAKSGLPATTRLVLHTLGLKMDATGGSCYPPISEIVELSGLDKKTVLKHLEIAEEKGWIEVSQHGFRGQKWKRNEYVARWPGRDLIGEAANTADEEGGGAVPPPSVAAKVVELVPEGGGFGSQKVVEQLHQDKNLPDNSPANSPSASAGEGGLNRVDRKKVEHAFTLWYATWNKGDVEFARNAWFALSQEDRAECIERTPNYLRWAKPSERMAAAVYLKNRHWRDMPELRPESERTVLHNAYSKAWSARRFFELAADPAEPPVPPTRFQMMELQKGGEAAEKVKRERRLAYGWPKVINMHRRAEMAEGVTVTPWLVKLSEGFVGVHRDSELAARWRRLHEQYGWPPLPERVEWLFFPPGEPEQAVADFREATTKERGNDDAA